MSEIKFQDVAHLYIGCRVKDFYNDEETELVGVVTAGTENVYVKKRSVIGRRNFDEIKPILRPLSDMTEEEVRAIYKHIHFHDLNYAWKDAIKHLKQRITEGSLMVNAELFLYLLKQGFDLFNLIESSQAISSPALKGEKE